MGYSSNVDEGFYDSRFGGYISEIKIGDTPIEVVDACCNQITDSITNLFKGSGGPSIVVECEFPKGVWKPDSLEIWKLKNSFKAVLGSEDEFNRAVEFAEWMYLEKFKPIGVSKVKSYKLTLDWLIEGVKF